MSGAHPTFTGNKALQIEEPLLFEIGEVSKTGVDLDEPDAHDKRLGGLERKKIGLPGLSEPEAMRHYVRLSQKNFAIDAGIYPLGSCTMKHNPRLNEKMARLPGFGDVHPLQPQTSVQGALELLDTLAAWPLELTGQAGGALSAPAGARWWLRGLAATPPCWGRNRPVAPTRRPRHCSATRCVTFPRAMTAPSLPMP